MQKLQPTHMFLKVAYIHWAFGKKAVWLMLAAWLAHGCVLLYLGTSPALAQSKQDTQLVTNITRSAPTARLGALSVSDLRTFVEVFDLLRKEHVDKPSDKALFNASIVGLLSTIDSNAKFYSKRQYQELLQFTEDSIADVGIRVALQDGTANKPIWRIDSIAPRSAADFGGVKTGLVLTRIDGEPLQRYRHPSDAKAIHQLLAGGAGTFVALELTNQQGDTQRIQLTRKHILDGTVVSQKYGDLVLVRIPSFVDTTADQLQDLLSQLSLSGTQDKQGNTVVLDMRGNPGGVLSSAVKVAELFLTNAPVATIMYKDGFKKQLNTKAKALFAHVKLAVLTDRYTASAAEVLAAALQDANRARVFGETTYGKGSVQKVWPLHDGRAVRFTVAHYVSPKGAKIDGVGVRPSVYLSDKLLHTKDNNKPDNSKSGNDKLYAALSKYLTTR